MSTNPLIDEVNLTKWWLQELHNVAFDEMMATQGGLPRGGQPPLALPGGGNAGVPAPNNPAGFAQMLQGVRAWRGHVGPIRWRKWAMCGLGSKMRRSSGQERRRRVDST